MILSVACVSSLILAKTGYCVPALPSIQEIEQPDGYRFAARQWGDEKAHGWETADGYTIEKDPDTNYWRYTPEQTGGVQLQSAGMVGDDHATAGLRKHIRPAESTVLRNYSSSANTSHISGGAILQSTLVQRSPVSGTRPIPVMMVNFSDTTPTFDTSDFQSLLFGTGTHRRTRSRAAGLV